MKKFKNIFYALIIVALVPLSASAISISWEKLVSGGIHPFSLDHVLIGATATTTNTNLEVIGTEYLSSTLGIGTTTPSAPLNVSSISSSLVHFDRSSVDIGQITASNNDFELGANTNNMRFSVPSGKVYSFATGNVGIGTTTPSYKFSVGGAAGDTSGNGYFTGNVIANNFYDLSVGGSTCIGESAGLLGTSNCVSSIASAGSTLTVSSPTGAVDVSFNLAHANTWSALQQFANASSTTGSAGYFAVGATATTTLTKTGGVQFTPTQPATSTAMTLNWSTSPEQVEYQIGASATTITLINATTSAEWGSIRRVWICNPGSTAGALTWAGVEWIGTAPTQTTTANQCDVYVFNITHATSTSAYKVAGQAGTGLQ